MRRKEIACTGIHQTNGANGAAGVVLMPGALLPLWLMRRSELQVAEAALAAPEPFTRLIVVVRILLTPDLVLCGRLHLTCFS